MNDNYRSLDEGVKLHLDEANFMKRQWFNQVVDNLERVTNNLEALQNKVDSFKLEVQKEREEAYRELISLRDDIYEKLQKISSSNRTDMEQCRTQITKAIDNLKDKVGCVDECVDKSIKDHSDDEDKKFAACKDELKYMLSEVERLKKELHEVSTKHQNDLTPILTRQTEIDTRLKVYIGLASLVATIFTTAAGGILLLVFKSAFKAWIQG